MIGGRVAEGMRLLDEASTIAAAEELRFPLSQGWALCYLIAACDGVGDFPRATQWCMVMREVAERWGARQLIGVCRSTYGRVLATSGDWVGAEGELVAAVGRPRGDAARPGLRRARAARRAARAPGPRRRGARAVRARRPVRLLGLGELALHDGRAADAADAAERVLRRLPAADVLGRVPALELLVRARAELGRLDEARVGVRGPRARLLAARHAVPARPRPARRRARSRSPRGDHEEARRASEDAIDRLTDASAPYDAAVARLWLARALRGAAPPRRAPPRRRAPPATRSPRSARCASSPRAEALLAGPGGRGRGPLGELSAREVEVLRLVAQGLGDAEIAERLVLSPHTVHRHVANVRTKLRLPSRTAAVAYAARAGLL